MSKSSVSALSFTNLLVKESPDQAHTTRTGNAIRPEPAEPKPVASLRDSYHTKMREEVIEGLSHPSHKSLPLHYTYDELGSKLFHESTLHPDYHLTRTEMDLLTEKGAEILRLTDPTALFEFGAGNCVKSRALLKGSKAGSKLREFWPLDINGCILREVCPQLVEEFPSISVNAIIADHSHFEAVAQEIAKRRKGPVLYTFFGSSFGNLDGERQRLSFLQSIRTLFNSTTAAGEDDYLLLGLDLVGEEERMLAAYDNPSTEAFYRNLFRVFNRELGTNFHNDAYTCTVTWQLSPGGEEGLIESYFTPSSPQHIVIPPIDGQQEGVEVEIGAGEGIKVGNSVKFTRQGLETLLHRADMALCGWFTDSKGYYALALAKKL